MWWSKGKGGSGGNKGGAGGSKGGAECSYGEGGGSDSLCIRKYCVFLEPKVRRGGTYKGIIRHQKRKKPVPSRVDLRV